MKKVNRVQRLAKRGEKAVISRIFWLTFISFILIAVIFTVGVSFLGKFADFLDIIFKRDQAEQVDGSLAILPPIVDLLPNATNEKSITISGFSSSGERVEIFVNSDNITEAVIVNGRFEFKDIRLREGSNKISVKAVDQNGILSDFSKEHIIILDKQEPDLIIISPLNNQNISGNNRIKITGKSELDTQVFANGFLANLDSGGNFEVIIPLTDGENTLEVMAVDEAGNTNTKELKVHYSK